MKYDYFVAARFRNKEEAARLTNLLRKAGKSVYFFAESRASIQHVGALDGDGEQSMKNFEAIGDWRNHAGVREVFETDMNALRDSKALILLLPAGKSAHMEAGVAYGMGKKTIVIGEQKETETLYLIFDEHYDSIERFFNNL